MREGSLKESIYRRSVLGQLHIEAVGPDRCTPVGCGMASAGLTVTGMPLAAKRAVEALRTTFYASGVDLSTIALTLLLPAETQEEDLKMLMRSFGDLCRHYEINLLPPEVTVSPFVHKTVVEARGMGRGEPEALKIRPDMDIVCIGEIAREGTAVIASEDGRQLAGRFSTDYVHQAAVLFDDCRLPEGPLQADLSAAGEGGIFAALWKLAAAGKVGLLIDLTAIPVRQHTIEVCEYYQLNPYQLASAGSLLAVCENGHRLARDLKDQGICAAVIGTTTGSNDKIVRYDDEIRFLEPPKRDELYRYWKID